MDERIRLPVEWSIGEDAFAAICEDLQALSPQRIVEFGCGPSTVRLALAFPQAQVLSVENGAQFAESVRLLARDFSVSDRVHVSHRPLTWWRHGRLVYQSYARGSFPEEIDAVIIDGPPSYFRGGREACLHQVISNVRTGGRIYLDDFRRPAEKRAARNWALTYPGVFHGREMQVGHGVYVMEKLRPSPERPAPLRVAVDVVMQHARRGAGYLGRPVMKVIRHYA